MGTSSFAYITSAQASDASGGSTVTTSPNVDVSGQNLLIFATGDLNGTPSPTDSSSNTYTSDYSDSNVFDFVLIEHSLAGSGGSSFNWSATLNRGTVIGAAFSGAKTSSVFDGSGTTTKPAVSSATSYTSGNLTGSTPGCGFVSTFSFGGIGTPGSTISVSSASAAQGWTMAQVFQATANTVAFALAYKIDTDDTPVAQSCTFDVSSPGSSLTGCLSIAAYRPQTFTPGGGAALTGVAGTCAVGNLGLNHSQALAGVSGTGAAGTVTPGSAVALMGVSATGSVGTLTPNISIPLTGVAGMGQVGTVSLGGDKSLALTGVAATGGVGTVGVSDSIPITGASATSAVGTVGRDQLVTILLTGVAATGQVGDVAASGDKSIALTGVQATGQVGTVGVTGADNFGDAHDPGIRKYLGDLEKRRKKRWEDEVDAKKRHREQTIAAFEKIAEERPEVAREIAQPFLPKKPKYLRQQYELPKQTIFKIAADVEAAARIWEAYIEMDDEEVLRYL